MYSVILSIASGSTVSHKSICHACIQPKNEEITSYRNLNRALKVFGSKLNSKFICPKFKIK